MYSVYTLRKKRSTKKICLKGKADRFEGNAGTLFSERQKCSSPLLGLQGSRLFLFLLKSSANLFQLYKGVGCWVRGHGGILDEGVRRQHVIAELRTHPWVHCPRPLYWARPARLMTLPLLRDQKAPREQIRESENLFNARKVDSMKVDY